MDNKSLRNETILVCVLITATIWASAIAVWLSVTLAVISMALIIRSWIIRGDNGQTIGFCPDSLRIVKPLAIFLPAAVIVIVAIGYLINPEFYKRQHFVDKVYQQAMGPYLAWSVVQEWLLNGYFSNRVGQLVSAQGGSSSGGKNDRKSALIVGLFFAFLHLPNPVLTIGTFFWAGTSCYLFLKYSRNAYLLGFAHSILGTAIKFVIAAPLIGSGCMRVGPDFWR